MSVKRAAREADLEVGSRVKVRRAREAGGDEELSATVYGISELGVAFQWEDGDVILRDTAPVSDVALAPAVKTALSQEASLPTALSQEAVKWSPCSTQENNAMVPHLMMSTLYQAYVARSSAHDDLHVVESDGAIAVHAKKEMKPHALVLLPFAQLDSGDKSKGVSVPLVIEIAGGHGEETTTATHRLRAKVTPKKITGGQERAVALVPFWALAASPASNAEVAAGEGKGWFKLEYQVVAMAVPSAPALSHDEGLWTKAGKTKSAVLRTVCLVNTGVVPKGSRLYVANKPPAAL